MSQPNEDKTREDSAGGISADELRWLWVRVGVRLGVGLLVIVATLLLILGAG